MAPPLFSFGCVEINWNGLTRFVLKSLFCLDKQNKQIKVEKCIHIRGQLSSMCLFVSLAVDHTFIHTFIHSFIHSFIQLFLFYLNQPAYPNTHADFTKQF